ncbi:hypothetical protein BB561_001517 [Smittium simulii]|uniref:Uncharacterized protein n=1 Tax=Smittium simulii TaxID=133385 RepID=A0A2T9YUJ2_9FUNG|nr:hypothetical protein BB561_001517 [Smittium simulii]
MIIFKFFSFLSLLICSNTILQNVEGKKTVRIGSIHRALVPLEIENNKMEFEEVLIPIPDILTELSNPNYKPKVVNDETISEIGLNRSLVSFLGVSGFTANFHKIDSCVGCQNVNTILNTPKPTTPTPTSYPYSKPTTSYSKTLPISITCDCTTTTPNPITFETTACANSQTNTHICTTTSTKVYTATVTQTFSTTITKTYLEKTFSCGFINHYKISKQILIKWDKELSNDERLR